MKYALLFCLVLVAVTACHKSETAAPANYTSITPTGSDSFTNSLMLPQAAVAAGNQIVFGAGSLPDGSVSDSAFIFDMKTNQWSATAMTAAHWLCGYTAVDDLVIFAGGDNFPTNIYAANVDIYSTSSGKWITATLSQGRYGLAGASAGSIAAFGGGQTSPQNAVATVDLYDAKSGTWTTGALSVPRSRLAAAGAGTKIVFAGGETNSTPVSDAVDIYDTKTGQWTNTHLSEARWLITATAVGNQLLFAGGYNATGWSDAVDIYDVSTGEWSTSRLREPGMYSGAAASGNLACFLAARNQNGSNDTIDIYNASTRSWSFAPVLPADRYTLCGAAIGDRVVTLGGNTDQSATAYYFQLK
jgi:hypothetical protein